MLFEQAHLDALARALADDGLTGTEIGHLLRVSNMGELDPGSDITKWKRLQIAFARRQNEAQNSRAIQHFIRQSMAPANHLSSPSRQEEMRFRINRVLVLTGLRCTEEGKIEIAERATTLGQAETRARNMRIGLEARNVHGEVLRFCSAEWMVEDYFHAVQEAVKSVTDRLRNITGMYTDGSELVNYVLGGENPLIFINDRQKKSEKDEQKGFVNLLNGVYGMFRNPISHEARINWPMTQRDAEDIMSMISLLHRRLDSATLVPRV